MNYILNEVLDSGQPIDFTIPRNYDGVIVKTFQATQGVTEVNIEGMETGIYSVYSNYNGETLSANFIITSE